MNSGAVGVILLGILLHGAAVHGADEWGYGRYRYSSVSGNPTVFTVDNPIDITFHGPAVAMKIPTPQDIVQVPSDCRIEPGFTQSTPTRVKCSLPGTKKFTIGKDDMYIEVQSAGLCFSWYVAVGNNLTSYESDLAANTVPRRQMKTLIPNSPGEMRVWIVDYLRADEFESAGTAVTPSSVSRQISREHHNLGEIPSLTTQSIAVDSATTRYTLQWDNEGGFWRVLLPAGDANSFALTVTGRDVSVLGCGVHELSLEFSILATTSFTSSPSNIPVSMVDLQRDACRSTVAIARVHTGLGFYFTQLNFQETEHVQLSAAELGGANNIESLVLTADTLIVLANTGIYVSVGNQPFVRSLEESNNGTLSDTLPVNLDRLTASKSCDRLKTRDGRPSPLNEYSAAWSSLRGVTQFYQSTNGGRSFFAKKMDIYGADTIIYAVSVLQNYPFNFALVGTNHSTIQFVLYETDGNVLTLGYEVEERLLLGPNGEAPQVTMSLSGSGEVFVFGATLLFSPDGGKTAHRINLLSRDPTRPAVGLASTQGEYIVECVTSLGGNFAVRTSWNRVFYGQNDLPDAIEISGGIRFAENAFMLFNTLDELKVYTPTTTAPFFDSYTIPLQNEVSAPRAPLSLHPDVPCPYLSRVTNVTSENYLDMNEKFAIETQITPRESYSAATSVIVSANSIVTFRRVSETTDLIGSTVRQTQVTEFSERSAVYRSYDERLKEARGNAAIRLAPRAVNLECPKIRSLARVRVGCPLNRHIRFKKPVESQAHCGKYESGDYVYEIPGSVYNDKGLKDFGKSKRNLFRTYDYAKYGCPTRVFHGTLGYRIQLELWDGDTYVKDVDANFVIHDIHGRFDFSYNATNQGVDCKIEPQTRLMMERITGLNNTQNWTPSNYVSCFGEGQRIRYDSWKKTAYEVLNSTGPNAMRFLPTGRDGIFIFQARVVDPDYSYCELTTEFALEVYGAPLTLFLIIIILLIVLAAIAVFLMVSYVYYRKKKLHVD